MKYLLALFILCCFCKEAAQIVKEKKSPFKTKERRNQVTR